MIHYFIAVKVKLNNFKDDIFGAPNKETLLRVQKNVCLNCVIPFTRYANLQADCLKKTASSWTLQLSPLFKMLIIPVRN
jgi:hypothetical protein